MSSTRTIRLGVAVDRATLDQVIELGDRNSKTLGFLPYAGFRAAASDGRIAIAQTDDGTVLGYCLFDLPREVVRIVQVCVSEAARGAGLARLLVEQVGARHSDRLGLVLKCRADWPADKLWPKLGFIAQTQVPGRSKGRHPLTVWWRSHGHPDLFTLLEENKAECRHAAVDSNIYCDLHSRKARQGSKHTASLAPFVADGELNIVLLPSLDAEIYATTDAAERARFLNAKVNYTRVSKPFAEEIVDHLLAGVPNHVLSKDESLRRDAQLVAEAYANGIDLFITRDQRAIKYLTAPAGELEIEVLHPSELPTHLDVGNANHSYQPVQLEETTFTIKRLDRALTDEEVTLFLSKPEGERLSEFRGTLADLAARSTTDIQRSALFDGEANLHAAWATESHNPVAYHVPLLRIAASGLQTTIAAQLSQLMRLEATSHGQSVVRITDSRIHKAVRATLETDGFYADPEGLAALTMPIIGSWPEVSAAVQSAAERHGADALLRLLELPEDPSPAQTAEFERLWAPAKILGQGVLNYLIPIKRPFAAQLLGYPASLMSRPDDLGLSREHVYYRSHRGQPKPPARILWYVSGKTEPSVIATSRLVEQRVDSPQRLHRRYARLGVWDLTDIENASSDGRAGALRFADTELFSQPVGLDQMRALVTNGRNLLLRSIQELDDDSFGRIYRQGVQR